MVAETATSGAPLFDAAHLARYTGGDDALKAELLLLMSEQARRCIALMADAPDRSSWRAAAHTLKGSARGVGAFALADLCEQVEEMPEMAWSGARLALERKFEETLSAFD